MTETLALLRSLGFGGLLGGGIGGLICFLNPNFLPLTDQKNLQVFIVVCGLIGGGLHGLLSKLVAGHSGNFVVYYTKLASLIALGSLLGKKRQREMIKKLTEKYILGMESSISEGYGNPIQGQLPPQIVEEGLEKSTTGKPAKQMQQKRARE